MKVNITKLAIVLALFLVLLYVAYRLWFAHHFTLENIKFHGDYLSGMVSRNYTISVITYMLVYFVIVASLVPATAPVIMAGGFLFGTFPSVLYSTIAATCGATLSFLLFRVFSKSLLEQKYAAQLKKFRGGLDEYGAFYLLILHFMFIVPFFVINVLAALAGVSLWRFVWTTVVGFLPCALVYSFSGKRLLAIRSVSDIFSKEIIFAVLLLIIVVILPILFKRYKKSLGV